jgi:hypothetical protein
LTNKRISRRRVQNRDNWRNPELLAASIGQTSTKKADTLKYRGKFHFMKQTWEIDFFVPSVAQ